MNDIGFKIGAGMHRALYKATRGRIGSRGGGLDFLLLTTIGRKTGKKHTVPLQHFLDSDKTIVVASKGGSEHHPHWYLNLRSNPQVVVQIKKSEMSMLATTAFGEERNRLWKIITARYGGYDDYQKKTNREIPIVTLSESELVDQELADS